MENIQTQEFGKNLLYVLNSIGQLNNKELDVLYFFIRQQKFKNHPPILSKVESELLQEINSILPIKIKDRFDELRKKLFDETLTDNEHEEYLNLTDRIEKFDAERIEKMIALSKIRNITLDELSNQLGLKPQIYVA